MEGNFAITAPHSPLLHQLPFPVWLLLLLPAVIFFLLLIAVVSALSRQLHGDLLAFYFEPFLYVKKPALRWRIWFYPVFCCSLVWLLIYFSLGFSVLICFFCSLIREVCCRSGKWDFERNPWWKFSEELSMYLQDKKWWWDLSAAEAISLLLKFLLVCIVWSAVANFIPCVDTGKWDSALLHKSLTAEHHYCLLQVCCQSVLKECGLVESFFKICCPTWIINSFE